jgi:quercetin dioxygenase-like cupin family protein
MAQVGERIENPVTGEQVVFRATAADTAGALLSFEYVVPPRYVIAPPHVHRAQEERTEVLAGKLSGRVAWRKRTAMPGEAVAVPPGVVHAWRNASDEPLHAIVEFRPALRTKAMLDTLFALARAGRTNARGLPPPLYLAVLAHDYCDEAGLPLLPRAVQRAIFAGPAVLGRRLGYG